MANATEVFAAQIQALLSASEAREIDREALFVKIRDGGYLPRMTLVRYLCRKQGCLIATVYSLGGCVYCAVRDYKFSPGMNSSQSNESGRRNNTLDGDRHWPARVYDVRELAEFAGEAGFALNCRHAHQVVNARELLDLVDGVEPGRPIKPLLI